MNTPYFNVPLKTHGRKMILHKLPNFPKYEINPVNRLNIFSERPMADPNNLLKFKDKILISRHRLPWTMI